MADVDLETIRKKNIQRNKDLLKKLNLDVISDSLAPKEKPKRKQKSSAQSSRSTKKPHVAPTRRSRRLADTPEDKDLNRKKEEEYEEYRLKQERLRELRQSKLLGEYRLVDLLIEKGLGNLRKELEVLGIENFKSDNKIEIKLEGNEDESTEKAALDKLQRIGERMSTGDFSGEIEENLQNGSWNDERRTFDELSLNKTNNHSMIKLTYQRITSLHFHSSLNDRLAIAGDTNGALGLWAVDLSNEDEDPCITIFKPHGRTVSRITEIPQSPSQIISVSYDGSARVIDLHKQFSKEILSIANEYEEYLGLTDLNIHPSSPQVVLVTTLGGHLHQHDLRTSSYSIRYQQLLRLHDKKIGGFCINPSRDYQIASASLDRSFKVWDLRSISKKNSPSEISDGLSSPHLYGSFSSKLSVSNVDWNSNNHLVCNGYDDKINLFDLSGDQENYSDISRWSKSFVPSVKSESSGSGVSNNIRSFSSIPHNCQTGRWVSILKARWQKCPLDGVQKFVIANMNRSFDIYSQSGKMISSLLAPEMTAVPAVAAFHPSQNWLIGGTSSGKVYLFD